MSEDSRPQLNLGTPPGKLKNQATGGAGKAIWVLVLLQVVTLACLIVAFSRLREGASPAATKAGGEDWRAVAMQLEDKSLAGQAARAWEKCLDASPSADDHAEILYRIGKLYLQAEEYGPAAAAFVRCEQAAGDDEALTQKLGPHLLTCLRRLGLYGEVGRELSRRVEAGADDPGQGKVLATLAGEDVTEADLDRMIEQRVDQMLTMQGGARDEQTRQMLLKQFQNPQMRDRLFQELLQRELFTRRARELKLDRNEEFVHARHVIEEDMLARRFQDRELAKIQPTDVDLQAYFTVHEDQYEHPEMLQAVFAKLKDGEDAGKLLDGIKSAEDLKKVVAERRSGDADEGEETAGETITKGRVHPQLGNTDALFDMDTGTWTDEPHENGDDDYLVLVESKTPARTLSFEEVRPRVEAEYRARKQQELSQKLFQDLMVRYEVKMNAVQPSSSEEDGSTSEETKKADEQETP